MLHSTYVKFDRLLDLDSAIKDQTPKFGSIDSVCRCRQSSFTIRKYLSSTTHDTTYPYDFSVIAKKIEFFR